MSVASLQEHIATITKKYGDGTIRLASKGRGFQTKRFQIGIFDVDAAIGGGIPWGRFLRAYGPYSGGKTALWLKAVAGCQRYCRYCRDQFRPHPDTGELLCTCAQSCDECKVDFKKQEYVGETSEDENQFDWKRIHDVWECECLVNPPGTTAKRDRVKKVTGRAGAIRTVWVDAENCYDRDWAESLGVDNDLVFVVVPEYLQQAGDIVQSLIRSQEVDLFVIDSIAELVPSEEIEKSNEDYHIGLHARKFNQAMRKWGASIAALGADATMKPAVLLVNQTRESLDRGEVTPGGWQQYFKSSIDIRVGAARYAFKEYKKGKTRIEEMLYLDATGTIKKNKCITGDTAVFLPVEGRIAFVEDLVGRNGVSISGWNKEVVVDDYAHSCVEQEIDEIIKISVKGVGIFRGNADHPIMVVDQFKKLGDVQIGDVVPIPYMKDLPEIHGHITAMGGTASCVSVEEGLMLGLLTGDGWVGGTTGVSLTSDNADIVEKFSEAAKAWDCEVYPKDDLHWVIRHKDGGHKGKSNKLYAFLRKHELWGKRSWSKIIPPALFGASAWAKLSFLEGLIATDGYVAQGVRRIGITTVSRELAEGLRVLLSSLGCRASVRSRAPRTAVESSTGKRFAGTRMVYEIRVNGHHAERLSQRLGWLGGKECKFKTWPIGIHDPIIPTEWARMMIDEAEAHELKAKDFALEFGFTETGWDSLLRIRGKKASRTRAEALCKFASPESGRVLELPLDFAVVTKIEADGEEMVYDICGTQTETFIAQGLIAHNTHPPYKKYSFRFYCHAHDGFSAGSTNEFGIVLTRALEWDIIDRPKINEYRFGKHKWTSQKQIIIAMKKDETLFWEIRDQTMTAVVNDAKGL